MAYLSKGGGVYPKSFGICTTDLHIFYFGPIKNSAFPLPKFKTFFTFLSNLIRTLILLQPGFDPNLNLNQNQC